MQGRMDMSLLVVFQLVLYSLDTIKTASPYHNPVSHQTTDDDISSVAFRSVTFTSKSSCLHLRSEGGDQETIYIQKHGYFSGKNYEQE